MADRRAGLPIALRGAGLLLLAPLALLAAGPLASPPAASAAPLPPPAGIPAEPAGRPADADDPPIPTAPDTAQLRVLVYNVHAGRDPGGRPNLDRLARVIREARADVVLLQEVDRGTRRSGGTDQLRELERRTGLRGVFGRTLRYQGGGYGVALLSRWPVERRRLVRLPVRPEQARAGESHEPRGALVARIAAPGRPLFVVNTHLDASEDDFFRRQEAATLLVRAAALRGSVPGDRSADVLLGGDFNEEPGGFVIREVREEGWRDAWRACRSGPQRGDPGKRGDRADLGKPGNRGHTYPSDRPRKRIDYLFLSASLACHSAAVLPTAASDHRPLLVLLRRR